MHPPDLASITTLVDVELKRLDDSRREHGWTPWLLLTALSALGWKFTEYLATAPHWHEIAVYWALLTVVGLTIESIVGLLDSGDGPRRPGLRFFPSTLFSSGRSACVFTALKIATAACVLILLTPFSGLTRIGWIALFGFYFYVLVTHVAFSWTDFPNPVGTLPSERRRSWIIAPLFWLVHFSLVGTAVATLWPRLISSYEAAYAHIAILMFAVVYLTELLLRYRIDEPVRRQLIYLRRSIGLAEIDADNARARFIEIIYGSELAVLMRPRFERVEQFVAFAEPLLSHAEASFIAAMDGGTGLDANAAVEEADDAFSPAENAWILLEMRIMVLRIFGWIPEDVAVRHAELKARIDRAEKKLSDLRDQVKKLRERTRQRPAPARVQCPSF